MPSRKLICTANLLGIAATDNARGLPRDGICVCSQRMAAQIAEYANVQGITDEPVFTWWVHCILKSRDHIVATVNKHYHKWMHKYGLR